MLRRYSGTAEHICKVRWGFVEPFYRDIHTVLDYGSGVGWFRAWRPTWVQDMDSYDAGENMNIKGAEPFWRYPQTGITLCSYDLITLWDVLEHLPDFTQVGLLLDAAKYAALTVPIKPPDVPWAEYKHFKPNEHLHYFTPETLAALFAGHGMKLLREGTPECPPREHVTSFIFGREGSVA